MRDIIKKWLILFYFTFQYMCSAYLRHGFESNVSVYVRVKLVEAMQFQNNNNFSFQISLVYQLISSMNSYSSTNSLYTSVSHAFSKQNIQVVNFFFQTHCIQAFRIKMYTRVYIRRFKVFSFWTKQESQEYFIQTPFIPWPSQCKVFQLSTKGACGKRLTFWILGSI